MKDDNVKFVVRLIADPSHIIMQGTKENCDEYKDSTNIIMGAVEFETAKAE